MYLCNRLYNVAAVAGGIREPLHDYIVVDYGVIDSTNIDISVL